MTEAETLYVKALEKELKNLKEENASQLDMYEMTALYLKQIQADLQLSEQKLLHANKHLTDSINYAKHIQDAFIVRESVLQKIIPQSFIFQQPKDIVSGDFVWAYENDGQAYIGAGDCTGHGVPGAMLSIFVVSMLNQIASQKENESPAGILAKLDVLMHKYLTLYSETQSRDSAELSLIKYDSQHQTLFFSGAKRPLAHVRKGVLTVYDGAKFVLGNDERRIGFVSDTEVYLLKDDMCYLFSDGFGDQFGGENNSKFTTKKLLSLLQNIASLPLHLQREKIASTFKEWKGTNTQIDDVLVLGIQV